MGSVVLLTVVEGRGFKKTDWSGSCDPFCVVETDDGKRHYSSVQEKNLTPQWDESFTIFLSAGHSEFASEEQVQLVRLEERLLEEETEKTSLEEEIKQMEQTLSRKRAILEQKKSLIAELYEEIDELTQPSSSEVEERPRTSTLSGAIVEEEQEEGDPQHQEVGRDKAVTDAAAGGRERGSGDEADSSGPGDEPQAAPSPSPSETNTPLREGTARSQQDTTKSPAASGEKDVPVLRDPQRHRVSSTSTASPTTSLRSYSQRRILLEVYDRDVIGSDQFIGAGSIEVGGDWEEQEVWIPLSSDRDTERKLFTGKVDRPGRTRRLSEALGIKKVESPEEMGQVRVRLFHRKLAPTETPLDIPADDLGFLIPSADVERHSAMMKSPAWRRQEQEWNKYYISSMNFWKEGRFKQLVRDGIPRARRGEMWTSLTGAKKKIADYPGKYEQLVSDAANVSEETKEQIDKDLHRTFPGHYLYSGSHGQKGRDALRRVLMAFSVYDPETGYCQSMNYITALLLIHMTEEQAFWVLASIAGEMLVDYYSPQMSGCNVDVQMFEAVVKEKLPAIAARVEDSGVPISLIVTQWFLCLFVNIIPTETCCRFLDVFFHEGWKILFRMSLALLKCREKELVATSSFDKLYSVLKESLASDAYDADSLLKTAFSITLRRRELDRARSSIRRKIDAQRKDSTFRDIIEATNLNSADLEMMYAHFSKIDEGGGGINKDNFAVLLQNLGYNGPKELYDRLFTLFDKNQNGKLDFKEFACGTFVLREGNPDEKMVLCFQTFDLDGNGSIDRSELSKMLQIMYRMFLKPGSYEEMIDVFLNTAFTKMDLDHDSVLSYEEFKQVVRLLPLVVDFFQLTMH